MITQGFKKKTLKKDASFTTSNFGDIILVLIVGFILLLIFSPAFANVVYGLFAIFDKYDRSEISNSTYFALTAKSVGITAPSETLCSQDTTTKMWNCYISVKQGATIYPGVNIVVNVHNGGTKMRTVYAKPIVGYECDSISKCEERVFLQSDKKCTIAPGQDGECVVSRYYEFKKDGIYKIYPGYMCDVTTTDGCFEPGATKAEESYNGQNNILVKVTTTK